MDATLIPVFGILLVVAPIACFVWQFRRVRKGLNSRGKGLLCYVGWSATPLLFFIGLFLMLVGAEEVFDLSLVGEGYARSVLVLGGGGLALIVLGAIIFLILVAFLETKSV